jgi:putative spermidine/putrescine transport system permease protein
MSRSGITAPDPGTHVAGVGGGSVVRTKRRSPFQVMTPFLAMTPFTVYVALGLFLPMVAVSILAFKTVNGKWTMHNINLLFTGVYAAGFKNSIELALFSSVIPGILGVFLAHAIATSRSELLRRLVASASGVLANFGGVNLAFIFLASYGLNGIATVWLKSIGVTFQPNLSDFNGVVFVYMYFQIPLMVLIVTPALGGLRQSWREAAEGLGASTWSYWRRVGVPVLTPAVLGGMLLLFGSGFAAYATVQALTAGSVALAPVLIGDFLNGNNLAGYEHVGYAIGFGMLVVLLVTMVAYVLIQRRATRWLR